MSLSGREKATLEDLRGPLDKYEVLIVETESYVQTAPGVSTGTGHVTAIRDRKVHDLPSMGTNGYARTDRVTTVYGRP
jgi:hypothetical protein